MAGSSTPSRLAPFARLGRASAWLLAGLLLLQGLAALLRTPCVGVADNLDYWRVAQPAGIEVPAQPRQGSFVVCEYEVGPARLGSLVSSPALLAWLSRGFRGLLGVETGRFALRQIGLLYWLLAAGLFVWAYRRRLPAGVALAFAWVMVDPGFLLFSNSLYADPAALLGLLAAVVALSVPARDSGARDLDGARLGMLLGAAALAGFGKMQTSPFPLVLLAACALGWSARRCLGRAEAGLAAGLGLLALAAPAHFVWGDAPRFLDANNYNAVYGGIARVASQPAETLAALGIPPEHRARPAKDFFAARVGPDDPVLPALRELSRLRLAMLYLGDPPALGRTASAIARDLTRIATHPRGTLTKAESGGERRLYRSWHDFSLWRGRLLTLVPAIALWLFITGVAILLAVRWLRRRWLGEDSALALLTLWLSCQTSVAVLGEGLVNLHQHLLGARLALDLMLVLVLVRGLALAAAALNAVAARRAPRGADASDSAERWW